MKKLFLTVLVAFGAVSFLTGCSANQDSAVIKGEVQNIIVSSNTTVAGKIVQMNVQQGQSVKKGDVIAVIDSTNQKYIVDGLQAVVDMKKAKLEELKSGTRPEQIAQAQAQVTATLAQINAAKAQLAKAAGGARAEEIAAAQAAVDQSSASLSGAQIQKDNLEASLATAKSEYSSLLDTMAAFRDSEGNYSPDAAIAALDSQLAAHLITDAQYTEKVNAVNQLFARKAQLESAISSLEGQIKVAENQISVFQAGVDAAQSALDLKTVGVTSYDIQILVDQVKVAQASYDSASAQLKLLKSGSTSQAIAMAQADADQSAAQLNQAKYVLESCNIVALQDGIVISKNYELGDVVSVGNNIADIANLNDLYVLCYVPVKYLDKVTYGQELQVKTSLGTQTGKVIFIDLEDQYTPKDMQSSSDTENKSVKMKVSIAGDGGKLKSGIEADVVIPLK
jgi:HlyD family secretion protein